jgi:hypothetical protein
MKNRFVSPYSKRSMLLACTSLIAFIACEKKIEGTFSSEKIVSKVQKAVRVKNVQVSSLQQFYDAVNDPGNAGSRIVLAPGTYVLSPDYPNAGRVELQHNMELSGQPGHPELVIIDGSLLPGSSFLLPTLLTFPGMRRTGVVRMGNGSNAIEWLTLKGHATTNAYSVIETDLNTTAVTRIRVAHCIITGGQIGINIRNRDTDADGRTIEADILDNEIANNLAGFGQGIGFFNARDVSRGIIRAKLNGNYVHGNRIGLRAWNVVSNHCRIEVQSNADRFEENGAGIALLGGFNEYPDFTANDNYTSFEAHGAIIRNNLGNPAPPSGTAQVFPGAMMTIGAMVSINSFPGTTSRNRLDVHLWGCRIDGNLAPYDIRAFGARSTYPSAMPSGTDNVVNIYLHGISQSAAISTTPSFPIEPAGTNIVNVLR